MYSALEDDSTRGNFFSGFAGILFGAGWWFFIDGVAYSRASEADVVVLVDAKQYLPGIGMTLAMIMIVGMDWGALNADDFTYSGSNVSGKARSAEFKHFSLSLSLSLSHTHTTTALLPLARCFLSFALLIALGSIIGAIVIIVDDYTKQCDGASSACMWPGISILLQTIFIFLSTMIYRCFLIVD
jgi:hypothetical protein